MSELVAGLTWGEVPVGLVVAGDRRLEGHTYLADGYGIRRRIEERPSVHVLFSEVAKVWQPPRLKGYVVREGSGLPFLSAGQVFEARPRVRKWIAAPMVVDAGLRYVDDEMILLSCSGEVGRVTAVYGELHGKVITHDLLRVEPNSGALYGWLYAYMRTPTFYAVARASQYGHMIKHLEPEHVLAMPVVTPFDKSGVEAVSELAVAAIERRKHARTLQREADRLYGELVDPGEARIDTSIWHSVRASEVSRGRRRLEGQYMRSDYLRVEAMVRSAATRGVETVGEVTRAVTLGNRFRRYFGAKGTPYRSAAELFDVNAPVAKRIYAGLLDNPEVYMLTPGQIMMARSGQTYGLLGRTAVLTEAHRGIFGSDDLIRIDPDSLKIRTGYLQTVLSHELYGRPRVVRNASGTSIPHLDPVDIREVVVPRFDHATEERIGDLCEESVRVSADADALETEAIGRAQELVAEAAGLHGMMESFGAGDGADE